MMHSRLSRNITVPEEKIAAFCRRNFIRKLSFFGSALRNDFNPHSDVDVLVEFLPDAHIGFFELYDMEQELSAILGGRRVEINTPNSLSKYFRDKVIATAEVHYAGA
jgi:predicted nucleotidyltransferase